MNDTPKISTNTATETVSKDAQCAAVLLEAKSAMVFAAQHEESGLSAIDHQTLRQKILEVGFNSQDQFQIRVDSTLLSLDQKIFIERAILRHLDSQQITDATVYFKKPQNTAHNTTLTGTPLSPTSAKSPFGIKSAKKPIPGVAKVIVVASGKGGVGKSTVSTNIAAGLAATGLRVGLMDCDIYGPSSPMMLGVQGSMGVQENKLIPLEGHGVKVVSFGFLSDVKTPVIWRGPMVAKAIEQLCYDVLWEPLDVLVLDLPPGTGDVQMTLAESLPIDGAVIVTTPQDVALIDAHKAVSLFEKLEVPILGVVENMSYHECTACGHQDHIFGSDSFKDFLSQRKLTLLTSIPLAKEIRVHSDQGSPVVLEDSDTSKPYKNLCQALLESLTLNQSKQSPFANAPVGIASKSNPPSKELHT